MSRQYRRRRGVLRQPQGHILMPFNVHREHPCTVAAAPVFDSQLDQYKASNSLLYKTNQRLNTIRPLLEETVGSFMTLEDLYYRESTDKEIDKYIAAGMNRANNRQAHRTTQARRGTRTTNGNGNAEDTLSGASTHVDDNNAAQIVVQSVEAGAHVYGSFNMPLPNDAFRGPETLGHLAVLRGSNFSAEDILRLMEGVQGLNLEVQSPRRRARSHRRTLSHGDSQSSVARSLARSLDDDDLSHEDSRSSVAQGDDNDDDGPAFELDDDDAVTSDDLAVTSAVSAVTLRDDLAVTSAVSAVTLRDDLAVTSASTTLRDETTNRDASKVSDDTTNRDASKVSDDTTNRDASKVSDDTTKRDASNVSDETTNRHASNISDETTKRDASNISALGTKKSDNIVGIEEYEKFAEHQWDFYNQSKAIKTVALRTAQGNVVESVNGCAIISSLVMLCHHLEFGFPTTLSLGYIMNVACGRLKPLLRQVAEETKGTFNVTDINQALIYSVFGPYIALGEGNWDLVSGNILEFQTTDDGNRSLATVCKVAAMLLRLSRNGEQKVSATITVHNHATSISIGPSLSMSKGTLVRCIQMLDSMPDKSLDGSRASIAESICQANVEDMSKVLQTVLSQIFFGRLNESQRQALGEWQNKNPTELESEFNSTGKKNARADPDPRAVLVQAFTLSQEQKEEWMNHDAQDTFRSCRFGGCLNYYHERILNEVESRLGNYVNEQLQTEISPSQSE